MNNVTLMHPYLTKAWLYGTVAATWKGQEECLYYHIHFKHGVAYVHNDEGHFTGTLPLNAMLVKDPELLEAITMMDPEIETTEELYFLYLEMRHPQYSYH